MKSSSEFTEEFINGTLILSTIHNGYLVRMRYIGYRKRDARQKFKQHLKSL